jgi:hypothetical protein
MAGYSFFLYDPLGDGLISYATEAERDGAAERIIDTYLDDMWDDEVTDVLGGIITHQASMVNRMERPADDQLDENMSVGGFGWPPGMEYRCDYELKPFPAEITDDQKKLNRIASIIQAVDNRCTAADGPVTPTLQEMTQDEMSEIYRLAGGKVPSECPLIGCVCDRAEEQEGDLTCVGCEAELPKHLADLFHKIATRVKQETVIWMIDTHDDAGHLGKHLSIGQKTSLVMQGIINKNSGNDLSVNDMAELMMKLIEHYQLIGE